MREEKRGGILILIPFVADPTPAKIDQEMSQITTLIAMERESSANSSYLSMLVVKDRWNTRRRAALAIGAQLIQKITGILIFFISFLLLSCVFSIFICYLTNFFDRNRFYNNVCATNICIGRISWKPPNLIGRGELCGTLHYFLFILFVASPFICFLVILLLT